MVLNFQTDAGAAMAAKAVRADAVPVGPIFAADTVAGTLQTFVLLPNGAPKVDSSGNPVLASITGLGFSLLNASTNAVLATFVPASPPPAPPAPPATVVAGPFQVPPVPADAPASPASAAQTAVFIAQGGTPAVPPSSGS